MKRVTVLHREFTGPHDAESWTNFVAKFRLNLKKVAWQLLVAVNHAPEQVGNDFLVRRTQAEITLVAILQTHHLGTHFRPPLAFLPEFGRLHDRHQHLLGAASEQFLAHDGLDLA